MTRERAIAHGYIYERKIVVFLLNKDGKEIDKWELFQYWKPSCEPHFINPSGWEVDHQVKIKKGFVSGRQQDDSVVMITSSEYNNLIVIDSVPVKIA